MKRIAEWLGAALFALLVYLVAAAPAHAATFRWTYPTWKGDSTGAPIVGAPARWARVTIEFQQDASPRRTLYSMECEPGKMDGKRGWPVVFSETVYRDSLRLWIRTESAGGAASPWATAKAVKR